MSTSLANLFCRCIKKVRQTVRVRGRNNSKKAKESAAIAICTKTVLGSRRKTLKKFSCSPPRLQTRRIRK